MKLEPLQKRLNARREERGIQKVSERRATKQLDAFEEAYGL